jgi:tryptophan-rich sensory protein
MILSILGAIVALLIWRATQRRGADGKHMFVLWGWQLA